LYENWQKAFSLKGASLPADPVRHAPWQILDLPLAIIQAVTSTIANAILGLRDYLLDKSSADDFKVLYDRFSVHSEMNFFWVGAWLRHATRHVRYLQHFITVSKTFTGLRYDTLIIYNKKRCRRRHGMWSSFQFQLQFQLHDAWKFQGTPTLQSALEQQALDWSAISKHDARLLWRFLTTCDLDLWPFQLKNAILFTCALGNVYANFGCSTFFVSE